MKRKIKNFLKKIDKQLHRMFSTENDSGSNPMRADRAIEYAFVTGVLEKESRGKDVLDIGSGESSLTTIIASMGFRVDGIDLRESPISYPNVRYIVGNFNDAATREQYLKKNYDAIVLCSTVEHFGLNRYNSPDMPRGDIDCMAISKTMLAPGGTLVLTIPYGREGVFPPFHRVYNKSGDFMKFVRENFSVEKEQYYYDNGKGMLEETDEATAGNFPADESTYALGLFSFKAK